MMRISDYIKINIKYHSIEWRCNCQLYSQTDIFIDITIKILTIF